MVYYGLSLNTPNLYGDMYVNFFIGQIVEIPSVIATMWVIYRSDWHTVIYMRLASGPFLYDLFPIPVSYTHLTLPTILRV